MSTFKTRRFQFNSSCLRIFVSFFLSFLLSIPQAFAQPNPSFLDSISENTDQFSYTLGVRLKSNDLADWQQTARLRPVIGLSYGKWRIGIGDGRVWQSLGQFGSEPTLSYQVVDNPELNIGLSFRVHNVSTGESFDVFEGGKNTLRSRVMLHRKINPNWRVNLDWTQDLLNKGDSTTLNVGMSYAWPVFRQSELILNAGSTWATAEHWRNTVIPANTSNHGLISTGFEKINAGMTFKQSISRHWAWYSSLAVSKPIADLRKVQGPREIFSGQIGVLYFNKAN